MNNLEKAFLLFDAFNRQDPNTITWQGETYPVEFFFALKLHDWVLKLEPEASEALLLASRSQHIGRWTSARNSYPEGKAGYLNWRTDLAKFHAGKAASLLTEAGYEDELIARVKSIILKQNLRTDSDVQTMENALCLVFLQFQFDDFIEKHDESKIIRILQKSWNKMSQPGKDAAHTIGYSEKGKRFLDTALS